MPRRRGDVPERTVSFPHSNDLLRRAWELARELSRPNTTDQTAARALLMDLLHSPHFAAKSGEDRAFYWRNGYWPGHLM